jgi:hypothetical protein
MPLMAFLHIFSTSMDFRWLYPNFYRRPNYRYQGGEVFRHKDSAGRVRETTASDRYLHHHDGRLRNLIVQCTDDIFRATGTSTWRRTYIRRVSPLVIRIATWVIDYSYHPESWGDWLVQLLRAIPAAIAMMFVVSTCVLRINFLLTSRSIVLELGHPDEGSVWGLVRPSQL